jgi:phospholipid transport system substrate-binding protein
MTRPHSIRYWAIGMGLLLLSANVINAKSADSPLGVIRTAVKDVTGVLQNPSLQGAAKRHKRMSGIHKIVMPYFDARGMAQRSLGVHWRKRSPQEQKEFVRLFTELVEQSYADKLDRYQRDIKVTFDGERVDGNFAEVYTHMINPAESVTIAITYRLHNKTDRWLIYDVVIENVSLVKNYRAQFNRMLRNSSYEELVVQLKHKVQELASAS